MIKILVGEREEKAHRSVLGGMALAVLVILALVPARASAATNASLGGGNALARATAGQSQGLTNANPASNLLARLTFASTRGGKPETTPNENSNTGGTTSSEQSDGENGADATSAGGAGGTGGNPIGNSASSNGASNGGASAGNGGNGGPGTTSSQGSDGYGAGDGGNGGGAAPGGLVRAGNVVSNANALNMLNVNVVRISSR